MNPSPLSDIAALYDHKPQRPAFDQHMKVIACLACGTFRMFTNPRLYLMGLNPWRCTECERLATSGLPDSIWEGV